MEFGGVATGMQNAQLQAITAGIMSNSIGNSSAVAVAARMGISKVAVAVLEVTSVTKDTVSVNTKISNHSGSTPNAVSD